MDKAILAQLQDMVGLADHACALLRAIRNHDGYQYLSLDGQECVKDTLLAAAEMASDLAVYVYVIEAQ